MGFTQSRRFRVHPVLAPLIIAVLICASSTTLCAQAYTFEHFAGSIGGGGSDDGTGAAARFRYPKAVAVDHSGNIYVADRDNHTIRKISATGEVTTLAGSPEIWGVNDGAGGQAQFYYPGGIATDHEGNVYVADTNNHSIRKVTPSGRVTTFAGMSGWNGRGSTDGVGGAARFSYPAGVATDDAGNLYVTSNHSIRKITQDRVVTTLAGAGSIGSSDGTGSAARFNWPGGIATDSAGNIYVADSYNHTIRKVTPNGEVSTLAGLAGSPGSSDGAGSDARFDFPRDIATDNTGNIYVADASNSTIRKIASNGVVTTLAGAVGSTGSTDGTGSAARFYNPSGVATDNTGNIYVADCYNHVIRRMTPAAVVTTLAGLAPSFGSVEGSGSAARFYSPRGVATDVAGYIYVADSDNHTIRKVSPAGVTTTLAGLAGSSGSSDGTGSEARFNSPDSVAIDSAGNLYVTETHTLRRVTAAGVVTTVAGLAGTPGSNDGNGPEARFDLPRGVATDGAGNVYVADSNSHTIRKVTPGGDVTTLAGLAGFPGSTDGSSGDARFNYPEGVATDSAGNVFVADRENYTIRKVSPSGVVTTLAGLAGSWGFTSGTGTAARFYYPRGVATDSSGTLFVTDGYSIRTVTPTGFVATIAGRNLAYGGIYASGGSSDGTSSLARFNNPTGIATDGDGNIYVADTSNQSIRIGRLTSLPDVATIDRSSGFVGQLRQLGVSPQTGSAMSWRIIGIPASSSGAAALSATDIADPTFTPDGAGRWEFLLRAEGTAGVRYSTVGLQVNVATAAVSGSATICSGASTTISAELTGTPPWNLTWSDGITQSGITTSPATRSVSPEVNTIYEVTAVSDANGEGTSSEGAWVNVGSEISDLTIYTGAGTTTCSDAYSTQFVASLNGGPLMSLEWGWRSISGGTITPIATGQPLNLHPSAIGVGTKLIVVTATPMCGPPLVSNELSFTVLPKPDATITAASEVYAFSTLNSASVPEAGPGSLYAWSITGGSITGGAGTREIYYSADSAGTVRLYARVIAGGLGSCQESSYKSIPITPAPTIATRLFLVPPCRLIDSRAPAGPYGGPALTAYGTRNVVARGACGIPADAKAVVLNLTVVSPSAGGFLTAWPGGSAEGRPGTSTINFRTGRTRANNAIIGIGTDGSIDVYNGCAFGTQFLIDVSGYFK